jgi:hypothetical protein
MNEEKNSPFVKPTWCIGRQRYLAGYRSSVNCCPAYGTFVFAIGKDTPRNRGLRAVPILQTRRDSMPRAKREAARIRWRDQAHDDHSTGY